MAEQFVCKAAEFKDGDRRIVRIGTHEIGIFNHKGDIHAYSNYCLHQGGPACEGLTIAKVEEHLNPDKTSKGLFFSEKDRPIEVLSGRNFSSTFAIVRPSQAGPPWCRQKLL